MNIKDLLQRAAEQLTNRIDDCEEDLPEKGQPDVSPCNCVDCNRDMALVREIRAALKLL